MKKTVFLNSVKKTVFILPLLAAVACSDSKTSLQETKQAVIDSVKTADYTSLIRQKTIDSMNLVNNNSSHSHMNNNVSSNGSSIEQNNTVASSSTPENKKKKMSNKTKGALIGTGAGIVTGAIVGAATSKDKTKGAIVGGIIGGAVGSGVGYGVGTNADNKPK